MVFNVTEARTATPQLRPQKEELERQRAEFETLARDEERILSSVSHDRRAPLTSIQGFVVTLERHWADLDADPVHLERIVANSIDNARPYGAPTVVSAHQAGQQVHSRVRDHGGGIPEDCLPKLFTPFAQAQPTTMVEGGIGPGLSSVHHLAHADGGAVGVDLGLRR